MGNVGVIIRREWTSFYFMWKGWINIQGSFYISVTSVLDIILLSLIVYCLLLLFMAHYHWNTNSLVSAAFSTRLFAVLRFESVIHEFDPWVHLLGPLFSLRSISGSWVSNSHSSQFLVMGMCFLHIEGGNCSSFPKDIIIFFWNISVRINQVSLLNLWKMLDITGMPAYHFKVGFSAVLTVRDVDWGKGTWRMLSGWEENHKPRTWDPWLFFSCLTIYMVEIGLVS